MSSVSEEDVFTRLPDEVISAAIFTKLGSFHLVHLSCKPVSKRWRRLSYCMDTYLFDCDFLQPRLKGRPLCDRLFMLTGLITSALSASSCMVTRLVISGPNFSSTALGEWLACSRSTLQHLSLRNELTFTKFSLGTGKGFMEVFSCGRLKSLELSNWLFTHPCMVQVLRGRAGSMGNLVHCRLQGVLLSDMVLEEMLNCWPALESLKMEGCDGLESPSIVCSALKELQLEYVSYGVNIQKFLGRMNLVCRSLESLTLFGVSLVTGFAPALRTVTLHSGCRLQARVEKLDALTLKSSECFSWSMTSLLATITQVANLEITRVSATPKVIGRAKRAFTSFFRSMAFCEALEVGREIFECLCRGVEKEGLEMVPLPLLRELIVHMDCLDERQKMVLSFITANCKSLETVNSFPVKAPG